MWIEFKCEWSELKKYIEVVKSYSETERKPNGKQIYKGRVNEIKGKC